MKLVSVRWAKNTLKIEKNGLKVASSSYCGLPCALNAGCLALLFIPHICHFFYTSKIFGEKYLHRKTPIFRVKSVKNANFCVKSVKKKTPIFCVKLVKINNGQILFFTGAARGARDKYEVCSYCRLPLPWAPCALPRALMAGCLELLCAGPLEIAGNKLWDCATFFLNDLVIKD